MPMPVTSMKHGSLAATCPHVGQRLVFKSTRECPVEVKPLGERRQGKGFSASFFFVCVCHTVYMFLCCAVSQSQVLLLFLSVLAKGELLEPFREQWFSWGSITAWGNNGEICSCLSKTKTPWEIMKCIFYSNIQVKHHLFPSLCGIWTIFSFVLSWRKNMTLPLTMCYMGGEWVLCGGREAVTLSSHAPRCSLQEKGGIRDPCSYWEPSDECCRALSDECCRALGKFSKKMVAFFRKNEISVSFSIYQTYASGLMQLIFWRLCSVVFSVCCENS